LAFDLRLVFLFLLFVTAILFTLRKGPALAPEELRVMILDVLLVPAAIGTVAVFGFLLTRTDPLPLIRQAGYYMSLQQNVSFAEAIPAQLQNNLAVVNVERDDTDGDGFSEWVVFYQFDLHSDNSPIAAAIYDNDRGNPPVLFPYQLRPPGRDYLSEDTSALELEFLPVTTDQNGPDGADLDEILLSDNNQLAIFRFKQNSEVWDFPRDAPPRYEPVGFFRANGKVTIDNNTKRVTVIDRGQFERSQLAVRSIYALNPATNSYWDSFDPTVLAAPRISTIDFFDNPPAEILKTTFPEKIVLAFYASTCGSADETLCRNTDTGWSPVDFLAQDALAEFSNRNAGYFGLAGFGNTGNLTVSNLRYYPSLESDEDLLVTGSGRDVVTGEQAQFNVVDITFATGSSPLDTARYEMGLIEGQWKILRRVPVEPLALDSPTEIPTQ